MKLARSLLLLVLLLAAGITFSQESRNASAPAQEKGIISGKVVRADAEEPLGGIEVAISSTEQRDLNAAMVTGADGSFHFKDVPRGKYSLTAQGRGYSQQAYQQHDQYSTAIAVGLGLDSQNLIFPLTPDASISGTVVDDENELVRSGQVILIERDSKIEGKLSGRISQTVVLDDQGRYHFRHLRPGSYLVAVAAQPWYAQDPPGPVVMQSSGLSVNGESTESREVLSTPPEMPDTSPLDVTYRTTFYPDASDPEMATPIPVRGGERVTADITLRTIPALHLTIRNLSKNPSQPTAVMVEQRLFEGRFPINTRMQQINTGVTRFSGLPPGHFILDMRAFHGKEGKNNIREIELSADTEIDASDTSSNTVSVRGVVRLPDGSPAAGGYVQFFNRATREYFGAQVSGKGSFEVQEPVSGSAAYEIAVRELSDAAVQSITAIGAKVLGHAVLFPRAGPVQLTITMSKGLARIDGTVLRDDKPVSQSMVVLVPQNFEVNLGLVRRDQSDSDGTFSLYQIVPGRYTLIAIANGWDLDWQNPAVLRPYLERGQLVEVTASHTYKVSVTEQRAANEASQETRVNP